LTQTQSYSESHVITKESASLKIVANIANQGRLAFRITNLILSAVLKGEGDTIMPVGNLVLDTPYDIFQPIAFAPGVKMAALTFIRNGLALPIAETVLNNMPSLEIKLAAYELVDADGKPFAFNLTEVAFKTAVLRLDYGGRRPNEKYLVATN